MPSLAFSQAQWVWTDPPGDPRWCAARFRGAFSVETACRLVCHVSADSRYLLFLDGVLLGRGPARSDLRHYVYETYPLALGAGNHVLAAFVVSFQNGLGPIAEVHDRPGLLLELQDTGGRVVLATGTDGWRVQLDQAVRPAPVQLPLPAYYGVGASEVVDGGLIPKGWEQPAFDDSGWAAPAAAGEPSPRGGYFQTRFPHVEDRRQLVARDIPPLREEPRQFSGADSLFPLTVPAGGRREILLDAGEYADGFPLLATEGGAGGTVAIYYAEALTRNGQKGVRDAGDGGDVAGFCDRYHPGGGQETYMPLHWRAFRFVKLVVEAAAEPLTVRDFSYRMTGYPWERRAVFTVDGGPAELTQVQDVDFRTLARCTSETFMDCPYYEQL